jgi:hypothetical protein
VSSLFLQSLIDTWNIVPGIFKTLFVIIYGRIRLKAPEPKEYSNDAGSADTSGTTRRKFGELLVLAFIRHLTWGYAKRWHVE